MASNTHNNYCNHLWLFCLKFVNFLCLKVKVHKIWSMFWTKIQYKHALVVQKVVQIYEACKISRRLVVFVSRYQFFWANLSFANSQYGHSHCSLPNPWTLTQFTMYCSVHIVSALTFSLRKLSFKQSGDIKTVHSVLFACLFFFAGTCYYYYYYNCCCRW